jgi:excisionase family DNA binding protein
VQPSKYLKSKDAARYLAIHINTLHRWTKEGRIKAYRLGTRGDYRYDIMDLETFVKGNET